MTNNIKYRKYKQSDKALKIFLIIFIVGYLFFFTSNYTLPKVARNVVVTEASEILDMGNYSVTLDSWDYCKKDRIMIAIFEVSNITLNENIEVKFVGRSGEDVFRSEVIKQIDNYYVVKFWDIPRKWSTASITISVAESQCKVQTTDEVINKVNGFDEKMSDNEILIYANESKIAGLEKLIEKCKAEKKEIENQLDYSVEKINELEKRKITETEEEKAKTNDDINKISNDAENLNGDLDDVMAKIDEYTKKIAVLQEYIAGLKRGN